PQLAGERRGPTYHLLPVAPSYERPARAADDRAGAARGGSPDPAPPAPHQRLWRPRLPVPGPEQPLDPVRREPPCGPGPGIGAVGRLRRRHAALALLATASGV